MFIELFTHNDRNIRYINLSDNHVPTFQLPSIISIPKPDRLPTRRAEKYKTEILDCPICWKVIIDNDEFTHEKCKQVFHNSCIRKWRRYDKGYFATCPLCRQCI